MRNRLRIGVLVLLSLLTPFALGASPQEQPKRVASSLLMDAMKEEGKLDREGGSRNYDGVIQKYQEALHRAEEQIQTPDTRDPRPPEESAVSALYHMARCYEKQEPENIDSAQQRYTEIIGKYAKQKEWVKKSEEKVSLRGIDVILEKLRQRISKLRETNLDPELLKEPKSAAWEKLKQRIKDNDKDLIEGLFSGLASSDDVVRSFAAEKLAFVADEQVLRRVIEKLNDTAVQAGAIFTLRNIVQTYETVDKLEQEAHQVEAGTGQIKGEAKWLLEKAERLRKDAAELRHNLPEKPATQGVEEALQKILTDKAAGKVVRMEAVQAISVIHTPALEDLLISDYLSEKESDLRASAVSALGRVKSRKAVPVLMKLVQYQPGKDTRPEGEKDGANIGQVRRNAAEALGEIGKIEAIPALIEALDDDDLPVRDRAAQALLQIITRDIAVSDQQKLGLSFVSDLFEMTEKTEAGRTRIAKITHEERARIMDACRKWWTETEGVEVLIERFRIYALRWTFRPAEDLFDLGKTIEKLKSINAPEPVIARVKDAYQRFQEKKNLYRQDVVEVGEKALPQLYKFMGGETLDRKGFTPAARFFVAESLAEIAKNNSALASAITAQMRNILAGSDDVNRKIGAAYTLGRLPKEMVAAEDVSALSGASGLGSSDALLKATCAEALGFLEDKAKESVPDLNRAIADADKDVQVAALRALGKIKVKNADTVEKILEILQPPGAETKQYAPPVRESAVETLGLFNEVDPRVIQALTYARVDVIYSVQRAASTALGTLAKYHPQEVVAPLRELVPSKIPEVREAAAYAAGEMGITDARVATLLLYQLVDKRRPVELKDRYNHRGRMGYATALGQMKRSCQNMTQSLIEELLGGTEEGRTAVYQALLARLKLSLGDFTDAEAPAYDPKADEAQRKDAVEKWRQWFEERKTQIGQILPTTYIVIQQWLEGLAAQEEQKRVDAYRTLLGHLRIVLNDFNEKEMPSFNPKADEAQRKEKIEQWKKWVEAHKAKFSSHQQIVVRGLIRALEDETDEVRAAAYQALKTLAQAGIKDVNVGMLPSFDPKLRPDGEEARKAVTEWRKWFDANQDKLQ